jgi:hypothetical protein
MRTARRSRPSKLLQVASVLHSAEAFYWSALSLCGGLVSGSAEHYAVCSIGVLRHAKRIRLGLQEEAGSYLRRRIDSTAPTCDQPALPP